MGLAAGGMVVAGELWIPGQKLISIPSGKIYSDKVCFVETFTALPDGTYLKTLASEDRIILTQVYEWCPYANLKPGTQYVSQEYWFDRENVWARDFNNL